MYKLLLVSHGLWYSMGEGCYLAMCALRTKWEAKDKEGQYVIEVAA